jgi:hypothetical protein
VAAATHLFEEPGALEEVTRLAREWFARFLVEEPVDLAGSTRTRPLVKDRAGATLAALHAATPRACRLGVVVPTAARVQV